MDTEMVNNRYLILNKKKFSFESIKKGRIEFSGLSDFEIYTLQFCKQWLNNQKQFTIPTSGSTGQPKSIIIKRGQMVVSTRMTADALNLIAGDKALVCLDTAYIAGKMMLVRGFEIGMQMTIVTPSSNPLEPLPGTDFDFTALVPLQLQTILERSSEKLAILNGMKAIIVGGAPVGINLEKKIRQLKVPVYSTYGMTETVSHIALRRLNGKSKTDHYTALKNVTIGRDSRGCLTIRSALTENQLLNTNDIVEITSDNSFKWIGRADNVINTGGVKVQVEKLEKIIENVLIELGIEKRFIVAGVKDDILGQKIILILEGIKLSVDKEKGLHNVLNSTLNQYEIPKKTLYIKQFRETGTGKIRRAATLKMLENEQKDRHSPDEA